MNISRSTRPQKPLTDIGKAHRYWRIQGERTRHKLDLLGERAELETAANMAAIQKGGVQ